MDQPDLTTLDFFICGYVNTAQAPKHHDERLT